MTIQPLTPDALRPYGWLLGKLNQTKLNFWEEHRFDPGPGQETQILWVTYRDADLRISQLESHKLTQQAVVPLTGPLIQIVATSRKDNSALPDLTTLRAFRVPVGQGICMSPGCWHTTRVEKSEALCLMLSRASTTVDLAAHLTTGSQLTETLIVTFNPAL